MDEGSIFKYMAKLRVEKNTVITATTTMTRSEGVPRGHCQGLDVLNGDLNPEGLSMRKFTLMTINDPHERVGRN
jgi:hypothetical protein